MIERTGTVIPPKPECNVTTRGRTRGAYWYVRLVAPVTPRTALPSNVTLPTERGHQPGSFLVGDPYAALPASLDSLGFLLGEKGVGHEPILVKDREVVAHHSDSIARVGK